MRAKEWPIAAWRTARTNAALDSSGARFSLVLLMVLTSLPIITLGADSTRVVMVTGDHAPDGNGVFASNGLTVGGLNDNGQVVFAAQLVGTTQGNADNIGLFRGDGTTLAQIARAGQVLGPGVAFSSIGGFVGNVALNQAGQVASLFVLADGRSGVAVWTAPAKAQARVADLALVHQDVPISWMATAGITGVFQASTNAAGKYVDISGTIAPGPLTNRFVELGGATNGPSRYYRIRLVP
jgi:hypothetical protein